MKKYVTPEMEITEFDVEDVITESNPWDAGGDAGGEGGEGDE